MDGSAQIVGRLQLRLLARCQDVAPPPDLHVVLIASFSVRHARRFRRGAAAPQRRSAAFSSSPVEHRYGTRRRPCSIHRDTAIPPTNLRAQPLVSCEVSRCSAAFPVLMWSAPPMAFRMLVRWSQNSKVKLRAVAAQLVWSGELPMGGGASRRAARGAAGLNASGLLRRPARAEETEWREMTTPWGGEPRLKVKCGARRASGCFIGFTWR